jgi:hypothetical protein
MIKWKTFHKTLWATNHIIQNMKVFYIKMCQRLNNKVIFSLKKLLLSYFLAEWLQKRKLNALGMKMLRKINFNQKSEALRKKSKNKISSAEKKTKIITITTKSIKWKINLKK